MISNKILNRIKKHGRGWVFCPKYFYDLTTRAVIDNSLSKLVNDSIIVRLDRGIYYYPKFSKYVGMVPPNPHLLAEIIADNNGFSIFPSGAYSANILGFSTQVPAINHYLSSKKSMKKRVGEIDLYFNRSYLANLNINSSKLAYLLSALNYLGKDKIGKDVIKRSAKILDENDKKSLLTLSNNLSAWLSNIVHKIIVA